MGIGWRKKKELEREKGRVRSLQVLLPPTPVPFLRLPRGLVLLVDTAPSCFLLAIDPQICVGLQSSRVTTKTISLFAFIF